MSNTTRREVRVASLSPPISHYTDAVRFGNLLFISGMVALDEQHQVIGEGDVVTQAGEVFSNIGKVLSAEGVSPADILKVTIYLLDIADRPRINPVREAFFGSARPASTLVEVANLALPGLLVEVECVVGIPD